MRRTMLAVTAAAALSVMGCSPPAGRSNTVVATVAGRPITVAELDAEMRVKGVTRPEDPAVRSAMLERMIARRLLSRAARDSGVSNSPDARRARDIAKEDFDATLDRIVTLSKVAEPTEAEATAYVSRHPETFGNRTIYLLDQIQTTTRPDAAAMQALAATKTLEEVKAVLVDRKIAFRRGPATIDTLSAPPGLSSRLAQLPADEVFVLPEGGGVTINRIRASEVQPVTGATAARVAKQLLLAQRRGEALRKRLESLKSQQVTYGEGYAPPVPAKT